MITQSILANPTLEFAADVRAGLLKPDQKELPSKYLYDEVGSAIFEVISFLPQYGLTRADERLLRCHARNIVELLPTPVAVAELGSGSGKKTRWILESLCRRQRTSYYPIEISPTALAMCARELGDIDSISIVGFEREYLDGLLEVAAQRKRGEHLLILFLGSTIGNFEPRCRDEFLIQVRSRMRAGDALLIGFDLLKPVDTLLAAYDDPTGVTAAFNLNLLGRVNRELDGDFDLRTFAHEARFDPAERRIEMHLTSRIDQVVNIRRADLQCAFTEGESIWTESSHKFAAAEIPEIAREAGFECETQWVDQEWPFCESLWRAR